MHPFERWRVIRGMTQSHVAKLLKTVHQNVYRWECGRMPTQPYLDRIVILTNCEITANDWLGDEARRLVKASQSVRFITLEQTA